MNELLLNFTSELNKGNFSYLLLLASFLGGVLASVSPCTLGILPIVVGYVGGIDKDKNHIHTTIRLLFFVLGLSAILTVVGIFCALTGKVFMAFGGNYWVIFMASLIMVMGLSLIGVVEIPPLNFIKKMPKSKGASLVFYPFLLGILFALAATPCSTPILASIMGFATLSKDITYSAILLFLFSLGQGLIIILTGVFTSFIKNIRGVNKYSSILMKICGVLLIISSIFIFYKVFSPFLNF